MYEWRCTSDWMVHVTIPFSYNAVNLYCSSDNKSTITKLLQLPNYRSKTFFSDVTHMCSPPLATTCVTCQSRNTLGCIWLPHGFFDSLFVCLTRPSLLRDCFEKSYLWLVICESRRKTHLRNEIHSKEHEEDDAKASTTRPQHKKMNN